ncbi:Uncharacterised protein [Mycobacteroides abscessus subsp. abscessus]|nr:Uncharacterised protein [Mycobacteroides abscessus subsp. abscessus]
MVFVAVGEHDRDDVVHPVLDGPEVGQDQVHTGLLVLGEQHATVDDQQLAAVLENRHVAADFADTAEREHPHAATTGGCAGNCSARPRPCLPPRPERRPPAERPSPESPRAGLS